MIRILNTSFQRIAELKHTFLQWTRRYYRSDDFTLKIPLNEYTELGNYVVFNSRVAKITKKITDGDFITLTGREYGFPINKRIVLPSTQTGAGETLQKYYVTANCITETTRKILNFSVESDQARGSTITLPARYNDLEELLVDIYMRTGLGWCIEYSSGDFIFTTIEGKDRSNTQSVYPRVIFSEQFGNLEKVIVTENVEKYFNVAYMGGQGEGVARTIEEVGTATQNDRYELFVDAKNLTTSTQLQDKGEEVLSSYDTEYQIDASFKSTDSITYDTDFFLGDIVTIKHLDYTLDLRLLEVKQTMDTKETFDFVFGKEPYTINNALNQRLNLMNSEVRI